MGISSNHLAYLHAPYFNHVFALLRIIPHLPEKQIKLSNVEPTVGAITKVYHVYTLEYEKWKVT